MRSGLLLLADSRLPSGGHGHSGGVEALVDRGLLRSEADLAAFLAGRIATGAAVPAAAAAAACVLAGSPGGLPDGHRGCSAAAAADALLRARRCRAADACRGADALRAADAAAREPRAGVSLRRGARRSGRRGTTPYPPGCPPRPRGRRRTRRGRRCCGRPRGRGRRRRWTRCGRSRAPTTRWCSGSSPRRPGRRLRTPPRSPSTTSSAGRARPPYGCWGSTRWPSPPWPRRPGGRPNRWSRDAAQSGVAAAAAGDPDLLPADGNPLFDVLAQLHRSTEATLFAS